MSLSICRSAAETRGEWRNTRLLDQRKGPDAVMVDMLAVALVLGLVGLAVHVPWIAAVIVLALGLGFAAANRRRDLLDVVNRAADRDDERAGTQHERPRPRG